MHTHGTAAYCIGQLEGSNCLSLVAGNRLGSCLSPYLQQHATNPVHWQPWDEQALALAQEHDVPILLSIGYAACHWCHVMEHESFADAELAEVMNEHFICIKLDREERPDLDKTYQAAHFLLSRQSGGWPLTVFLAPDLVPFFTGTYFPPKPRRGMPSFKEVLARVSHAWEHKRDDISGQNQVVADSLRQLDDSQGSEAVPTSEVLSKVDTSLAHQFDLLHGGLGKAPKFPQAPSLLFALQRLAGGSSQLREGLERTLAAMACGGLHDHVGGGFFRYCVDPEWNIPHFEKMHYDNSLLLELYAQASIELAEPAYASVARAAARWLLTELRNMEGGILAAWDADSEGEEGKYYGWPPAELEQLLTIAGRDQLAARFNAGEPSNFEGACHLFQLDRTAYQPPTAEEAKLLAKLHDARAKRIMPTVDDKVLASACGLAAISLTRAGLMLGEDDWIAAARDAISFCKDHMEVDGQLRVAWREGQLTDGAAFLDDHAYLLAAQLNLLAVDCTPAVVAAIVKQADRLVALFDDGNGGLLFANKDADQVLRRIRACDDGPTPSGNGIAAQCLLQLGWLLGRQDYLDVAEGILRGFGLPLNAAPEHALTLTTALAYWHTPPPHVILTGEPQAIREWSAALASTKGPPKLVVTVADPTDLVAALAKPAPPAGTTVWAHVCRGTTCLEPVTELADLQKLLASTA